MVPSGCIAIFHPNRWLSVMAVTQQHQIGIGECTVINGAPLAPQAAGGCQPRGR